MVGEQHRLRALPDARADSTGALAPLSLPHLKNRNGWVSGLPQVWNSSTGFISTNLSHALVIILSRRYWWASPRARCRRVSRDSAARCNAQRVEHRESTPRGTPGQSDPLRPSRGGVGPAQGQVVATGHYEVTQLEPWDLAGA